MTSVRCLPEKYCAFVNFSSKEAAGKAMNALQVIECEQEFENDFMTLSLSLVPCRVASIKVVITVRMII